MKGYYQQVTPSSTDEEYESENNKYEAGQTNRLSSPSFDNSLNSRSASKSRSRSKSKPKSRPESKLEFKGRNRDKKENKQHKVVFETPSKSKSHHKNKSVNIYDDHNSSFQVGSGESKNEDKEQRLSKRIAPSHSNVQIHPIEYMGPPPRVSPYFYMTDKDFDIINGTKANQNVVTTVS